MTDRIADLDDAAELDAATAIEGSTRASDDPADTDPADTDPADTDPADTAAATSRWAQRRERRRHRVSKWDRPPEPKDWRFFVGTLGRVLIATGILMFGFVAYQLWGTGIETARAQNRLQSAFAAAIADNADADVPVVDTVPVTDTVPDTVTSEPIDEQAPEPEPAPDPEPSPIVPGAVDLSDIAVEQEIPPIERGDVIARLEIPKIHDDPLYVVAGVTLDDLKQGPGHYPDTPLPGQLGNAAIAGHRTTYGAPFFDVDQLVAGDQLVVTTIAGGRFVYEVTGVRVVSAADYWVVTTRDPNVAELTLTSCHPKYTARDRIVVHSVLVPELSSPVGVADLYELDDGEGDGAQIPGDDPTIVDDPAESDDPADPAELSEAPDSDETAEPDDVSGSIDETDDGESTGVTSPADPDAPLQIDGFSQGWFDDDEAWPQIALWGFVLTLISLLAYQVSKRTRHDSIGLLVGIAPFLVALYFFFQNVNRLLPPGL